MRGTLQTFVGRRLRGDWDAEHVDENSLTWGRRKWPYYRTDVLGYLAETRFAKIECEDLSGAVLSCLTKTARYVNEYAKAQVGTKLPSLAGTRAASLSYSLSRAALSAIYTEELIFVYMSWFAAALALISFTKKT